ncbi:MAG: polysaccharide pyruvyl transferase family protein [Algicola sp.]|nr:polysaccharide pyruvyl transferase family protein [Algicola sp.]
MKSKKVLIWGFYNQGNIGDDIMALIVARMIEELGYKPAIFSENNRFKEFGVDVASSFDSLDIDFIVMGGGAFLKSPKSSTSSIEKSIADFADYVEKYSVPVVALSIGSDGINSTDEMSEPRRRIVSSKHFRGASLRLRSDIGLSLNGYVAFNPDMVLLSKLYFKKLGFDWNESSNNFLINVSRRSLFSAVFAYFVDIGKPKKVFLAHSGNKPVGGELILPGLPIIRSDSLVKGVEALSSTKKILSSKLHPGIISLSFGKIFISTRPRPKTKNFLSEYSENGMVTLQKKSFGMVEVHSLLDFEWQENIWESYINFLEKIIVSD